MIKKIELSEHLSVPDEEPFGCRIRAAEAAYGLSEPFAQFWKQEGNGTVLGKLDDGLVLSADGPDVTEWKEFIRILGVRTLLCSEETAEQFGYSPDARGEIMVLHPEPGKPLADVVMNPSPREIYALLQKSRTETFVPPDFESFYMDLSFRTRHGTALTAGVRQGGELAACAVCSAKTEHAAIVSSVACLPELRRHGYAGTAVCALTDRLQRPNVYIFRRDGENEAFYRSLGFVPYGRWAEMLFG